MRFYHSPESKLHEPDRYFRGGKIVPHPESAERYDVLYQAACEAGLEPTLPEDAGLDPIRAVHADHYTDFLSTAWSRRNEIPGVEDELLNGHFAKPQMHRRPVGLLGLLGYYAADTSTPIRAGTWQAIYQSAQVAIAAADAAHSSGAAYALSRPPGHHAFADCAAGFCYLNNAAIAARRLQDRTGGKTAVIDIDVHHGNGTQSIFYESDEVLTISIHCDTSDYYPFYAGYTDETGSGAGEGWNVNMPLPRGTGDGPFLAALDMAIDLCRARNITALTVALGLDAAQDDPLGTFNITQDGFAGAATRLAAMGLPTTLVQEGGYLCPALSANLTAFLTGFQSRFAASHSSSE